MHKGCRLEGVPAGRVGKDMQQEAGAAAHL